MTNISHGKRPSLSILLALAVLINMLWSFSYPLSKILMDNVSPLSLAFWRLTLAPIFLLPFIRKKDIPQKITRKDIFLILGMGIIGCAGGIILQYVATVRTLASNISLIIGMETVIVILLASVFLKETFRFGHALSILLAFAGMAIITVDPSTLSLFSSNYFAGNVLMLLSVFGYAFYTIFGKILGERWGSAALTAITFVVADLVVIICMIITEKQNFATLFSYSPLTYAGILFTSVVATALCYQTWNYLLKYLSARQLSFSLYLQPAMGPVFSMLLLHETLNKNYFIGGILVILAIYVEQKVSAWVRPGGG